MVTIEIHWIVFTVVVIALSILTLYPRDSTAGNFTPDMSILSNLFWGIVLAVFILVWGGFFWW